MPLVDLGHAVRRGSARRGPSPVEAEPAAVCGAPRVTATSSTVAAVASDAVQQRGAKDCVLSSRVVLLLLLLLRLLLLRLSLWVSVRSIGAERVVVLILLLGVQVEVTQPLARAWLSGRKPGRGVWREGCRL